MSEKEKKQAIVLGALLAVLLAGVLIFDPFDLFRSGSSAPVATEEEVDDEDEAAEDEEEEQEPVASATSPRSDRTDLPIYHELTEIDGEGDPAHTDVWPNVEEEELDEDVQVFDVRGFNYPGNQVYVQIGGTRYTVDDRVTCNQGDRWRIEDVTWTPRRFQAMREDPPLRQWFDRRGYPIND